jgi:hypothetical protein
VRIQTVDDHTSGRYKRAGLRCGWTGSIDRAADRPQQVARPGTLTVFLEPLYKGGLDDVTAGSSCIANVYTSNHDLLAAPGVGSMKRLYLHMIDTIGIVHALILRLQALVLPIKVLIGVAH